MLNFIPIKTSIQFGVLKLNQIKCVIVYYTNTLTESDYYN